MHNHSEIMKGARKNNLLRDLFRIHEFNIFLVLLLIFISLSVLSPEAFLSTGNILNVLNQASITFIMAAGMTLVIILGGIDLSIGYVMSLSGIVVCQLIVNGKWPIGLAIIVTLLIGAIIGAINGIIISKLGIVEFITTLAMMLICHGITYSWTGGYPIINLPMSFTFLGQGKILGVRVPIYVSLVIFIVVNVVLNRTKLGTEFYATGGNKEAARLSGINVDSKKILVHTFCSMCGAMAGILMAARLATGQPNAGDSYSYDVIGGAILGGTSPSGGVGKVYGTLVGVLIFAFIQNGLTIINVNFYMQEIVKGAVILVALAVNAYRSKMMNK